MQETPGTALTATPTGDEKSVVTADAEGLLLESRTAAGMTVVVTTASVALLLLGGLLAGFAAPQTTDWGAYVGLTLAASAAAGLLTRLLTPSKLPNGATLATLLVHLDRFSVSTAVLPGATSLLLAFLLAYGIFPLLGATVPQMGLVLLTGLVALVAFPGLQSLTQRRVEQTAITALRPSVNLSALFAALAPPRPLVPLSVRLLIVLVGLLLATALYVALVLESAGGSLSSALPALLAGLALLLATGLSAAFALLTDLRERVENLRNACDELTAGHEVTVQPGFALDELGAMSYAIRRISEAQQALGERIQRVAEGNLHVEFRGRNRLGAALRQLVDNHRELVQRLQTGSGSITGNADEARQRALELSDSLSAQFEALEQTARAMSELRNITQQMTDDSQAVAGAANQSRETVERTSRQFDSLIEHQTQIEELLDTVREIADRSQILALNASLEGVRAGEAGRGFSLVAVEMRRMAERVKNAAEDIRKIVVNVQHAARATLDATKQGRTVSNELAEGAQRIAMSAQQQQTSTMHALRAVEHLRGHFGEIVEHAGGTQHVTSQLHEAVQDFAELFAEYASDSGEPSVSDESWSYTEIARMMLGPAESGRKSVVVPEEWRLPEDVAPPGEAAAPREAIPHAKPASDLSATPPPDAESDEPPAASGEPDEPGPSNG